MHQYEAGQRSPKAAMLEKLAAVLDVSAAALQVPDMESAVNIMHIIFVMEDTLGAEVCNDGNHICLRFQQPCTTLDKKPAALLQDWCAMHQMVEKGQLNRHDYDTWRYQLGQ